MYLHHMMITWFADWDSFEAKKNMNRLESKIPDEPEGLIHEHKSLTET